MIRESFHTRQLLEIIADQDLSDNFWLAFRQIWRYARVRMLGPINGMEQHDRAPDS